MKLNSVIVIALSVAFVTGCAKLPTQTGTWTGVGVPVRLYTAGGRGVEVAGFRIQRGPVMGDPSYRGGVFGSAKGVDRAKFIAEQPIIVDEQLRSYSPAALAGRKLQVRGKVLVVSPIDSATGEELIRRMTELDSALPTAAPAVIKASKCQIVDLGPAPK